MSESMVERVARAICGHLKVDPDGTFRRIGDDGNGYMSLPVWNEYAPLARAAVEAMYNPTRDMVDAGARSFPSDGNFGGISVEGQPSASWRAMVQAALAEPATPRRRP